jgi:hypothetical protein
MSTILLASPCCLEVICNDPLPLTSSSLVQSFFNKKNQKISIDVGTNVERFLNADLILDSVLILVLTMRTD